MKETPLKLRIPYAQSFIPPRGRKMRTAWFLDEDAVMIRAIEPNEAPVAYRVGSKPLPLDPGAGREYAIRSFEGKLWWPLSWDEGPAMDSGQFAVIAAQGIPIAVLAIDPSIAVPLRCWPLGLFGKDPVREEGDSDKGERWAWAQRNATRVCLLRRRGPGGGGRARLLPPSLSGWSGHRDRPFGLGPAERAACHAGSRSRAMQGLRSSGTGLRDRRTGEGGAAPIP